MLVVEGTLVGPGGSPWQATDIVVIPMNDDGSVGIFLYGADPDTGVLQCLSPSAQTDKNGHFSIKTGPLWKIVNFFVVGIYGSIKGAGLVSTKIMANVNEKTKEYFATLNESEGGYTAIALIPVLQGDSYLKIVANSKKNRIDLGKIIVGTR